MSLEVKGKTHVRLVFLGAAGVGKTALIRRFLQDTFEAKHRRTVEELHSREYDVSGVKITVEILDTSGSYSFPAMRKLSIQNSDALALVYAVDDPESLETVKRLREEILEASAKDNDNVVEVFKELLQQANLPSRLSPALCRRRETFPKHACFRPPMNKTNSCTVSPLETGNP